jgi:hypothetical protein
VCDRKNGLKAINSVKNVYIWDSNLIKIYFSISPHNEISREKSKNPLSSTKIIPDIGVDLKYSIKINSISSNFCYNFLPFPDNLQRHFINNSSEAAEKKKRFHLS